MKLRSLALAALAAFVVSIPSENGVTLAGFGSLSRLVGAVAFAITVAALFERGRFRARSPSLFVIVAVAFVLWNVATYFWSIEPSASFTRIIRYGQLGALAWMVHELVRSSRERDLLMQAFVGGCYVLIGTAVAAYLSTPEPAFRDLGRFNPNAFSIVAALGIPMAWALVLRRQTPILDAINAAYPAVAVLAVVLSASRGGLITTLVALAVVPATLTHLGLWRRSVLLVLLVLATWAGFEQLPRVFPALSANVERLAATSEAIGEGDLTGRTAIWRAGVEVFASAPEIGAVGVGSGGFRYAVEPLLGAVLAPHNGFLSVAVDTGLVGLALFAIMHVLVFASVLRARDRRTVYMILLAAVAVGMMPANAEDAKHTWFVLALLATVRPMVPTGEVRRPELGSR